MTIRFLFRLKKYGKWKKGTLDLPEGTNKNNFKELIEDFIQENYPDASRIEITQIDY